MFWKNMLTFNLFGAPSKISGTIMYGHLVTVSEGNIFRNLVSFLLISAYFWVVTRDLSTSGLREISSVRRDEQLTYDLGWQYNRFPDCRTDRLDSY